MNINFTMIKRFAQYFLLTELLLLLMQTILNLFQNTRGSGAREDILPHTSAEKQKQQAEPLHFIGFFLDSLKMLICCFGKQSQWQKKEPVSAVHSVPYGVNFQESDLHRWSDEELPESAVHSLFPW